VTTLKRDLVVAATSAYRASALVSWALERLALLRL
jgi:hypothetical protein